MKWYRPVRRSILITSGIVIVVVAAAGIAAASIPSTGGVIKGCYDGAGYVRVIDPALDAGVCSDTETPLDWSQTGPQGPAGATGPQGPAGATGPQGPAIASLTLTFKRTRYLCTDPDGDLAYTCAEQ